MTPESKKQAKSAVRCRVSKRVTSPESKKQAESVVRYRVFRGVTTPESKKQAKSAVRYRVTGGVTTPGSKKQAKSAVRQRVFERRKSRKTSYLVILWHFLSYNNTDLKILMSRRSKS